VVDEVLKYKRIDGVDAARLAIAEQIFRGGHQHILIGDRLASIEVPILIVGGAEDRVIPGRACARRGSEGADTCR
jgi:pyruvate dehydrogenase E2 component (dihydrolipoyllysine-residue acetyltransferase)